MTVCSSNWAEGDTLIVMKPSTPQKWTLVHFKVRRGPVLLPAQGTGASVLANKRWRMHPCDPRWKRRETTDRRIEMELGGLHHMTAVTTNAAENVAFYTDVLGLRLVKKTVNQDDVSAYHLFYGDEVGHPGTEVTFFDWPTIGSNVPGSGSIAATALQLPGRAAVEWWEKRFDERGVNHGEIQEREGRAVLPFTEPEGQSRELVDDIAKGAGQ